EHGNERVARQPAAALGLSLADDLGGPESPRNQGFVLVLPEALVRPDVLAAAAAGLEIHERGLAMLLREKSGRVGGEVGDEDLVLRVVVAEPRVRPVGRDEAVARLEPGNPQLVQLQGAFAPVVGLPAFGARLAPAVLLRAQAVRLRPRNLLFRLRVDLGQLDVERRELIVLADQLLDGRGGGGRAVEGWRRRACRRGGAANENGEPEE